MAVVNECSKRGYDGVICGHIHHAEIKRINSIDYYNCGDWVESCTALIENETGKIEMVNWLQEGKKVLAKDSRPQEATL